LNNTDLSKTNSPDSSESKINENRSIWNYHPDLPIKNSPVFDWPWRPWQAFSKLTFRWVELSISSISLMLAIVIYNFVPPHMEDMNTLSFSWMAAIFLRNFLLLTLIAGTLHLFLYTFKRQGTKLKYDNRPMVRNNRTFLFRNQVYDNMFWSLTSGVAAWSLFEILYFWAAANEWTYVLTFSGNEIWFFVWLFIYPILSSMHFYWVHRLLHWPPLYKRFHDLHHRNLNIGPWSGLSMHPVESLLYLSAVLIHFAVPTHPVIFLVHMFTKAMGPSFSHAGFEKVLVKDRPAVHAGDFHHQLHHRYFECNYGTIEIPWDKWFGSFHDGTEEGTQRAIKRRQQMYKR
jgi:lathosterol oxidase